MYPPNITGLPRVQDWRVEHVVTADDPFGEPWPPDGLCSVVRRVRGFTLWRRLSFKSASVTLAY
jgi:hypothetical protein